MLRSALLALAVALPAPALLAQPARLTTASEPAPAARPVLDLPALDARALGATRSLFSDPGLAALEARPERRARSSHDFSALGSAIVGVRGPLRRVHLIGSNVRADGAVETFVRAEFERGAEGLRLLWRDGHLATVQRGAPAASYAAAASD